MVRGWKGVSLPALFQPSPLGGRWLAEGQTDEGAGFGRLVGREKVNCPAGAREAGLGRDPARRFGGFLRGGGFRRLRAASFFPSDGKETKGSPGDGSGWTLRVHIRLPYPLCRFATSPPDRGSRPPVPYYGRRVLVRSCNSSGAQNLSHALNPSRATGP